MSSDRPRGTGGDYEVGYGKPPKHSRFQPGRSGNPTGRRRGVRNLRTDVKRVLAMPIRVKENGGSRKISTQEGVVRVLRDKALKGDTRALDRLVALAGDYNNDADDTGQATALSCEDQAILDHYTAEIAASFNPSAKEEAEE